LDGLIHFEIPFFELDSASDKNRIIVNFAFNLSLIINHEYVQK
jgi:hypothetical protein